MLRLALHVSAGTGLGLDLNPANFGREQPGAQLYYIDDEFYDELTPLLFAQAAVARIPEEPSFSAEDWTSFGLELGRLVTSEPGLDAELRELAGALHSYPVSEQFIPARAALVQGCLTAAQPSRESRPARGARHPWAVLADVHANLPALRATLAAAREAGAERFLILGDVVGYGPHPAECIEILASLEDAIIIRGNHDQAVGGCCPEVTMNGLARSCADWTAARLSSAERDWLAHLPLEHREGSWLAVHGAPQDARRLSAYVYELTYEDNLEWLCKHGVHAALHGHTHSQTVYAALATGARRLRLDGPLRLLGRAFLLNPGSVGQPRDQDARAAFALFDPDHGSWQPQRVAYPLQRTIRDIEERGLPLEAARRLRAGR
jgi:predicted phosphodiesterase